MKNWDAIAAWIRPRRWVAVVAGLILWSCWIGAILLGGSRFASTKFHPDEANGMTVKLDGRIALGNGETDLVGQITSIDHLAFYMPAKMIRAGRSGEIYDHDVLGALQDAEFPEGQFHGKLEAYRNPPFFALFHVPTAALPYRVSVWIWNGISFLALFLGILLLKPEKPWTTFGWTLTFMPTFTVLSYGQTSLLTFCCFALCYRLLELDRRFAAGMVASFLWLKPPLLMGLLLWWLWDRRYHRTLVGVAVGGALWLGLTYPVVTAGWNQFFAELPTNIRFDNFQWWKSHNARALWRLLFTPESAPLPTLLWAASAIVGVAVFHRVWRVARGSLPLMFGSAIWVMLWASPHTMVYEWTAALIPAILWWKHFPEHRSRLLAFIAILWVALFISTDFGHVQEIVYRSVYSMEPGPIVQVSMLAYLGVSFGLWHWIKSGSLDRNAVRPDDEPVPAG